MHAVKKWFLARPYLVASAVFLAVAVAGLTRFGWRQEQLQVLLLMYFLALLGIRLDDLALRIGSPGPTANPGRDHHDSVMERLEEIAARLERLERRLEEPAAGETPDTGAQTPPGGPFPA